MTDQKPPSIENATPIPVEFGLENEHPMLSLPFTLKIGNQAFEGQRISVTQIEVQVPSTAPSVRIRSLATLSFPFEDFSIIVTADVTVQGQNGNTLTLLFTDPTAAHFAQLRYIINSHIAGDLITLKGMMSYTGPTQPKAPKAMVKKTMKDRVRSILGAAVSLMLVVMAAAVVFGRYTTAYELHPVFVDRAGQVMQATVAGQLTYLDPKAGPGDVAYTIAATTGDVLSFQMPRDGDVTVASEIYEGATVLPDDLILTIFDDSDSLRLRTMISIEGLSRALQGDPVRIEMSDGRELPVDVLVRDTTRAAALTGDLYVPVDLAVKGEGLTPDDIGKSARLRLSKTLFGAFGLGQETE